MSDDSVVEWEPFGDYPIPAPPGVEYDWPPMVDNYAEDDDIYDEPDEREDTRPPLGYHTITGRTHPGQPGKRTARVSGAALGSRIPITYGTVRTAGRLMVVEESSNGRAIICAYLLCEGELSSISNIELDGIASSEYPEWVITGYPVSYLGTTAQSASTVLKNNLPKFFTSWPGTAWVILSIDKQKDGVKIPNLTADVTKANITDWNAVSSASSNPVVALYDFMTNDEYGLGIPSSEIDATSWDNVRDWCDETVNGKNRWEIHIEVSSASSTDVIDAIVKEFHGMRPHWYNGKWRLSAYMPISTVTTTFTNDTSGGDTPSIVGDVTIESTDLFSRPNVVEVSFARSDSNWEEESIMSSSASLTPQNERKVQHTLPGCKDLDQAFRWADQFRLMANLEILHVTVNATSKGIVCEPGDRVQVTSRSGLSSQDFRVIAVTHHRSGIVSLRLQEYDANAYPDGELPDAAAGTFPTDIEPASPITRSAGTDLDLDVQWVKISGHNTSASTTEPLARIYIDDNSSIGGLMKCVVSADDGTDWQTDTEFYEFAAIRTTGGGVSVSFSAQTSKSETSTGTLSATAASTANADSFDLEITISSSLTSPSLQVWWEVEASRCSIERL